MRYKFQPNEAIRWKVVHQALVRTTVSGTTQTAETRSESIKVWQIKEVDPSTGQATFVHSVDSVDMRQSVSGRQDVRYNSQTDVVVPAEFEEVAKSVGVPLSRVVLNSQGHVIKRHEERAQPGTQGEMTVPLPEKAVAVGESWSLPHDASVRQKDGSMKTVQTRQEFTLTEVTGDVATIKVETVVLTPIRDPALEVQLIQHVTDGIVRFDIKAGCVIGQQTDIDNGVIGFQGEASSLHYVTRFTEELMPQVTSAVAAKKPAAARPADAAAPCSSPRPTADSSAVMPEATAAAETSDEPRRPRANSQPSRPQPRPATKPPRSRLPTPQQMRPFRPNPQPAPNRPPSRP